MRKTIIASDTSTSISNFKKKLDLTEIAEVEVTSEDKDFPIEEALIKDGGVGWKASKEGQQIIRIIFDEPLVINNIHVVFEENREARTQEFLLRWRSENDQSYKEIVRQQYNFSPGSSTLEKENYEVNLNDVKAVEMVINPDIGKSNGLATLARLWFE